MHVTAMKFKPNWMALCYGILKFRLDCFQGDDSYNYIEVL